MIHNRTVIHRTSSTSRFVTTVISARSPSTQVDSVRNIHGGKMDTDGLPPSQTIDDSSRKRDKDRGMVILVKGKGSTFVPASIVRNGGGGSRISPSISSKYQDGTSQLVGPVVTFFGQDTAAPAPPATAPNYLKPLPYKRTIPTTYHRPNYRPYPYDLTTMFTDPPKHQRPPTMSRFLHAPSSQLLRESTNPAMESRKIHTSVESNMTQVLFYSKNAPGPSAMTVDTGTTLGQLASQFSTTAISRQDSYEGGFVTPNPSSTTSQDQSDVALNPKVMKARLRELRPWELTTFGRLIGKETSDSQTGRSGGTRFTMLSYNILSQKLMLHHSYIYKDCFPASLEWPYRFRLLIQEINEYKPNIVCLQEVEESEFHETFSPVLKRSGYRGVFKKRSGDKTDGCATFWSDFMFSLVNKLALNLRQGHVPLLNRDNIALMLKLETKLGHKKQRLVVANTHLLYNPKRDDVRLAQVQLLLAELDRFSFTGFEPSGESRYLATLLCGDFNTEAHSPVATLITEGSMRYMDEQGYLPESLRKKGMTHFLPATVGISDQCQHYLVSLQRVKNFQSKSPYPVELDRKTQLALINVQSEGSEGPPRTAPASVVTNELTEPDRPKTDGGMVTVTNMFDPKNHEEYMKEIRKTGIECSFGSGTLTHDLKLRNIYGHKLDFRNESREHVATTKHVSWSCVDFIFQSMHWSGVEGRQVEGNLKLVRRLRLLTRTECKEMGSIPNLASPSDHYPLLAEFLLK